MPPITELVLDGIWLCDSEHFLHRQDSQIKDIYATCLDFFAFSPALAYSAFVSKSLVSTGGSVGDEL